jgi:hypothetical protein
LKSSTQEPPWKMPKGFVVPLKERSYSLHEKASGWTHLILASTFMDSRKTVPRSNRLKTSVSGMFGARLQEWPEEELIIQPRQPPTSQEIT